MVGELMTLPVRAGVRVTRFALNTTLTVSARALTLAGDVLQSVTGRHEDAPSPPQRRQNGAAADEGPSRAPNGTPPKRAPSSRASSRPEPATESPAAATPTVQPASRSDDTSPEPADAGLAPEPAEAESEPEPIHVSEEPELVAEIAEPGAEDGAGASVTVDEPWEGYAHLSAKDIVDRLTGADAAELAAIQLFESTHKKRETVLTAVERELRKENASPRPDRPH